MAALHNCIKSMHSSPTPARSKHGQGYERSRGRIRTYRRSHAYDVRLQHLLTHTTIGHKTSDATNRLSTLKLINFHLSNVSSTHRFSPASATWMLIIIYATKRATLPFYSQHTEKSVATSPVPATHYPSRHQKLGKPLNDHNQVKCGLATTSSQPSLRTHSMALSATATTSSWPSFRRHFMTPPAQRRRHLGLHGGTNSWLRSHKGDAILSLHSGIISWLRLHSNEAILAFIQASFHGSARTEATPSVAFIQAQFHGSVCTATRPS